MWHSANSAVDFQVDKEVIIDVTCGIAVLRGANIFKAGILAMSPGKQKTILEVILTMYIT